MSVESFSPERLVPGDCIQVIATGFPGSRVSQEVLGIATERFRDMGLTPEYGDHVFDSSSHGSLPIESKIEDIHNGFKNSKYKGLLSIIGGFNTNSLLMELDWSVIESNPKVVCGTSDLTSLLNAIHARTGLVTYYGPHYSTFGQKYFNEYTRQSFEAATRYSEAYDVGASSAWTDDRWYDNQLDRNEIINNGPWVIQEGQHEAESIGGNLSSLNLLQGTDFFPSKNNPVVFIEEIARNGIGFFDRSLQSLLHVQQVGALLIGRMQSASDIDYENLSDCIATKKELKGVPVVANLDFGHTLPMATLPIGGVIRVESELDHYRVRVVKH